MLSPAGNYYKDQKHRPLFKVRQLLSCVIHYKLQRKDMRIEHYGPYLPKYKINFYILGQWVGEGGNTCIVRKHCIALTSPVISTVRGM
jgi:hypothetical protein